MEACIFLDDNTDETGISLNSSVGKVSINFFVHEAMPPFPYNGASNITFIITLQFSYLTLNIEI